MPNEREKGAVKALKINFFALVCFDLTWCEHFPHFYNSLCLQNNFGAGLHFKMGLACTEKPFLGFVMLPLIPPSLAFHPTQAIFALDRFASEVFSHIFLSPPNLLDQIYLSFFLSCRFALLGTAVLSSLHSTLPRRTEVGQGIRGQCYGVFQVIAELLWSKRKKKK